LSIKSGLLTSVIYMARASAVVY